MIAKRPSMLYIAANRSRLYNHAVYSADDEAYLFDILAGVLQGDTLAPCVFIIALEYALEKAINVIEEE